MSLTRTLGTEISLVAQALANLHTPREGGALVTELAGVAPPVAAFHRAALVIHGDPKRSTIGRHDDLAAARKTAEEAITTWATSKDQGFVAAEASAETTIAAALKSALPEPSAEQVAAMAADLRQFDITQVASLYASATDAERLVMERAAVTGRRPRVDHGGNLFWEPLLDLDSEPVRATIAARRLRVAPEAVGHLEDTQRLRTAFRGIAGSARSLVTAWSGPDPLDALEAAEATLIFNDPVHGGL